jgi:hypothetical protein
MVVKCLIESCRSLGRLSPLLEVLLVFLVFGPFWWYPARKNKLSLTLHAVLIYPPNTSSSTWIPASPPFRQLQSACQVQVPFFLWAEVARGFVFKNKRKVYYHLLSKSRACRRLVLSFFPSSRLFPQLLPIESCCTSRNSPWAF